MISSINSQVGLFTSVSRQAGSSFIFVCKTYFTDTRLIVLVRRPPFDANCCSNSLHEKPMLTGRSGVIDLLIQTSLIFLVASFYVCLYLCSWCFITLVATAITNRISHCLTYQLLPNYQFQTYSYRNIKGQSQKPLKISMA